MPVESDADRASFFADFGVSVAWSVNGVAASAFAANWDSGTFAQEATTGPELLNRRGTLSFPLASLPPGADADGVDNVVTIAGVEYATKSIEVDGTGMVIVRIEVVDP